jgi:hypothetical protein
METSETTQLQATPSLAAGTPEPAHALAAAPAPEFQHCDHCSAPVDNTQRYCVNCGAHRRHAPDPAARYLAQATARSRGGAAAARPGTVRRRGVSLASAAVLAVIPVAAAIGVEVGRSSNNQDSKLIQALARQGTKTVMASSSPGSGTTASSSASSSKRPKQAGKHAAKGSSSATAGGGKVVSSTHYGSATQITGSNVTSGQAAQGAADAKKIQNSTGSGYVQAANNLPSTVVP